ncbi:SDR family oxidoreductase [Gracilinema caldarium]|uniref:3-oxoacyl-(Acyl-carrier-protein) reductase n=1 Tax=Gracilinema caldarium (strain ATCC 51460 / DSM 7334 / H1) TaxID=744872 RepID=F8EY79_GRAC1|nr:SDR family oxidoreductase [Gracilinema caldarium]AEJ18238.1 3-oxoacyl-(acyl-carrier-protein) reductase [Gracilinema caldarium DSM 7334]
MANDTTAFVEQLFALREKRVIITGGAGAIASTMAEALIKAGAKVCLWGRGTHHPITAAVYALAEKTGHPEACFGVTVDTGIEAEVQKAIEETEKIMGPPNILINAAGGNKGKSPFTEVDINLFSEILENNLFAGLVIPTKHLAAYWISQKVRGTIINLTSMGSYIPLSGVWAYNAAKSAVLNLTMATAKEFAPYGIRVNAIAPGFFVGNQNRLLLYKDETMTELTDRGKSIIARTPFGRFGKNEELVGATIFLCSDQASGFITGVSIPVDGGFLVDNI